MADFGFVGIAQGGLSASGNFCDDMVAMERQERLRLRNGVVEVPPQMQSCTETDRQVRLPLKQSN